MADKVEGDRGVPETKVEDVVVPEAKDEFVDAFNEADKVGEKADLSAADDPNNVKAEEPPVVVPPIVTPPVVETPPVVTPPAEQQPGETDEKYEQRYKTLQGIHKHDRETWESEKAKLLSDLEEAKKPKTPEVPVKVDTATFIDSLTEEQQEQLKEYEKDFDVVSKMEGIKRSVELGKLRKEMESWKADIANQLIAQNTQIDTRLAPAVALVEDNERETHFNTIRQGYDLTDGTHVEGHSDFEKYRDDGSLQAWIESKPKYLQPALQDTYSNGSATDIIDLISDFKRESNITPKPASDNVVVIDPKKAARKQTLTTVPTRRGAVNTNVAVRDDFEGAFDEAVHK